MTFWPPAVKQLYARKRKRVSMSKIYHDYFNRGVNYYNSEEFKRVLTEMLNALVIDYRNSMRLDDEIRRAIVQRRICDEIIPEFVRVILHHNLAMRGHNLAMRGMASMPDNNLEHLVEVYYPMVVSYVHTFAYLIDSCGNSMIDYRKQVLLLCDSIESSMETLVPIP